MNVFPIQEGGMNRSAYGANASIMFPQCEFICPDKEAGIKGTCYRSPTGAHRGSPYFSNSRIVDFHEFDKCDDGCEPYYPVHCLEDDECDCPLDWGSIGGWPNQEALWHYYWKYDTGLKGHHDRFAQGPDSIHARLQPGDRLDLVLLSSMEINDCIAWELMRGIESGTAQLRLKCKDIIVSDVLSLSDAGCLQFWELPADCRVPECCVGWDMLQLELLDFPPDRSTQKKCGDDCLGKLHKLAFMTSVMGKNPCTGK